MPIGDFWTTGLGGLYPDMAGQILGRNFEIAVHEGEQRRFLFVLQDERLYDDVFINSQLEGALRRPTFLLVFVKVWFENNPGSAQDSNSCGDWKFLFGHARRLARLPKGEM